MVLVDKYVGAWLDKHLGGEFRGNTCVGQLTLMKTVNVSSCAGLEPSEKLFFGHHNKGWAAKNICTKSERLIVNCRVTWSWSERVNLHK